VSRNNLVKIELKQKPRRYHFLVSVEPGEAESGHEVTLAIEQLMFDGRETPVRVLFGDSDLEAGEKFAGMLASCIKAAVRRVKGAK